MLPSRAEEGLLQCGRPSHRSAQAPVLLRAMGAEPGFRPSEKGPVMMDPTTVTLPGQPCSSVKQDAPREWPVPRNGGRAPPLTTLKRAFGLAHECAEPLRPRFLPHRHVCGAFWSAQN